MDAQGRRGVVFKRLAGCRLVRDASAMDCGWKAGGGSYVAGRQDVDTDNTAVRGT